MNPVLGGDFECARHIRPSGLCKFLRGTRKENLEPRWGGCEEHAGRGVAGILERVDAFPWTPDAGARAGLLPCSVPEKTHRSLQHMESLILSCVIMRRRTAAGRGDFQPLRKTAAGLLTGEIEMNFFPKSMENAIPGSGVNGNRFHYEWIGWKCRGRKKEISDAEACGGCSEPAPHTDLQDEEPQAFFTKQALRPTAIPSTLQSIS